MSLIFGNSKLARHDCAKCGPNTLFKLNHCIHCGAEHKAEVRRVRMEDDYTQARRRKKRNYATMKVGRAT